MISFNSYDYMFNKIKYEFGKKDWKIKYLVCFLWCIKVYEK